RCARDWSSDVCSSDLRQFYRTLAVPVERFLFASRGTYGVTDNINVFFEGTYNKTRSSREIEPFAASTDTSTGVYPSAGVMPVEKIGSASCRGGVWRAA